MDRITFRQEDHDGRRSVYVVGGWPQYSRISKELMAESLCHQYVRQVGRHVLFIVANGAAIYEITEQDDTTAAIELQAGTADGALTAPALGFG